MREVKISGGGGRARFSQIHQFYTRRYMKFRTNQKQQEKESFNKNCYKIGRILPKFPPKFLNLGGVGVIIEAISVLKI